MCGPRPVGGPVVSLAGQPRQPCRRYSGGMRTFSSLAELAPLVGQEVATSDWMTITQEQVNLFADATGDHQWIHVDVDKARAGPFGAPIAHGFLTLSLLPKIFEQAL